jgi:hypothetical protein
MKKENQPEQKKTRFEIVLDKITDLVPLTITLINLFKKKK